jgi:hypothetical protein
MAVPSLSSISVPSLPSITGPFLPSITAVSSNDGGDMREVGVVVAPKPVRLVNPAIHLAALVEEGDATTNGTTTGDGAGTDAQDGAVTDHTTSRVTVKKEEEDGDAVAVFGFGVGIGGIGEDGENDADDEAEDEDKTVCSSTNGDAHSDASSSSEWTVEKVWQCMYEQQQLVADAIKVESPSQIAQSIPDTDIDTIIPQPHDLSQWSIPQALPTQVQAPYATLPLLSTTAAAVQYPIAHPQAYIVPPPPPFSIVTPQSMATTMPIPVSIPFVPSTAVPMVPSALPVVSPTAMLQRAMQLREMIRQRRGARQQAQAQAYMQALMENTSIPSQQRYCGHARHSSVPNMQYRPPHWMQLQSQQQQVRQQPVAASFFEAEFGTASLHRPRNVSVDLTTLSAQFGRMVRN